MDFVSEVLYYHHYLSLHSPILPAERISYWDMTFVLSGRFHYRIDSNDYILHRNDLLLMPPNILRERLFYPEPVEYISFNFTLSPGTQLFLPLYIRNGLTPLIRQALGLYKDEFIMPDCYAKEKITLIINFILYELMNNQTATNYSQHVNIMLKTIRERIYEPLSLSDVADSAELSLSYAANLFKKEIGYTIGEYILKQKMLLARDMILGEEMSLREVSEKLGYTNYSYFSAQFRKYYHCSPSEIRKYYLK